MKYYQSRKAYFFPGCYKDKWLPQAKGKYLNFGCAIVIPFKLSEFSGMTWGNQFERSKFTYMLNSNQVFRFKQNNKPIEIGQELD